MLIIRHLNGAQAGTEVKIEGKDRVVAGRQLDCDVQFPPEETAVARHHFALVKKPSGSWTVELFGTPFVAIDGTPADNGQVVRDGAKIELGRIGGPALGVGISDDARTDNYLKTAGQAEAPSARVIATQAGTMARLARAVAAVAVVVAVAGGAFAAYNYISTSNTTARIDKAQKEFASALAREAELRIGADIRAHIARAVYHVELQDAEQRLRGAGTAWVVGSNLLATNAHVGILREGLRPRERMIVRAPGQNGTIYEVVEHRLHPGYVPFSAFLNSDKRIIAQYRGSEDLLEGNGYDVALLRVSGTLPADARLDLASTEDLMALKVGDPLVTAGYPLEAITNAWAQGLGATPQQHLGVVTSVTDMFSLPAPFSQMQLIHHDMPSAGGQSGSPIVAASGKAVALLNSGNTYAVPRSVVAQGRMPSAAQINYGQRVDLIRDMLDGTAEQKLADARQHWASVTENFKLGRDEFLMRMLVSALPRDENDKPVQGLRFKQIIDVKRTLKAKAGKRDDDDFYTVSAAVPLTLAAGSDYGFLAFAEGGSATIGIIVDGKVSGRASNFNYPTFGCRLLAPAQQNTGNPQKPRDPCATGHERLSGMNIPADKAETRDVDFIVINSKKATDPLVGVDLNYTLRVYEFVQAN